MNSDFTLIFPKQSWAENKRLTSTKLFVIKCWYFNFTFESVMRRLQENVNQLLALIALNSVDYFWKKKQNCHLKRTLKKHNLLIFQLRMQRLFKYFKIAVILKKKNGFNNKLIVGLSFKLYRFFCFSLDKTIPASFPALILDIIHSLYDELLWWFGIKSSL